MGWRLWTARLEHLCHGCALMCLSADSAFTHWPHPGSKVPQIPREASGILHTLAQLGTEQGQGVSPCVSGSSQQPRNGALQCSLTSTQPSSDEIHRGGTGTRRRNLLGVRK